MYAPVITLCNDAVYHFFGKLLTRFSSARITICILRYAACFSNGLRLGRRITASIRRSILTYNAYDSSDR